MTTRPVGLGCVMRWKAAKNCFRFDSRPRGSSCIFCIAGAEHSKGYSRDVQLIWEEACECSFLGEKVG